VGNIRADPARKSKLKVSHTNPGSIDPATAADFHSNAIQEIVS
jgi:hypothetical protein